MGWAGVLVPEEHGGAGFGYVGAGLIAEEIGRNLSATPLLSTAVLAVTALLRGGSAAQKEALLPAIAGGDLVVALASDEKNRHAPHSIATRATGGSGKFKLNGRKVHVLDGHVADRLIVTARTSGDVESRDGITLFLVDAKATGVNVTRTPTVDSHNAAAVELRDVAVSDSDVIGTFDKGAVVLDAVLDAGRAVLAAELLGVAEESFERTLGYLREREQFGVKIGTFQALQHRAAHLFCEIELVRSVVLRTLQALDAQEPTASNLVCLAKAQGERRGADRHERGGADARRHRHDRRIRHRLLHEARPRRRRDLRRLLLPRRPLRPARGLLNFLKIPACAFATAPDCI